MSLLHQSVLLHEAILSLDIKSCGFYVDATFGRGGHSAEILKQLDERGRLLVIDKDLSAIQTAKERYGHDPRVLIFHGSFAEIKKALGKDFKVNGILADLGVSSPQLDDAERGFSFLQAGSLDMRMNQTQPLSAKAFIATVKESDLADVLKSYGEERYAKRIARAIVDAREIDAITTTTQLADIIAKAHPKWEKHKHPATRSFQAIRIFINRELEDLEQFLSASCDVLQTEGRLVVISFHSLEDRIVKQFIKKQEKGNAPPKGVPIREEEIVRNMRHLGKAIRATEKEVNDNIRSRSAIMRVAEKIG